MCVVRGSGRRRRRQKRVRNVKESKRARCGAQEPAPGPLWDCRRSRWASLMVGNNCTSLNSPPIRDDASCCPPFPLTTRSGLLPSVLSRNGSRNLDPTFELRGRRIGDAHFLGPPSTHPRNPTKSGHHGEAIRPTRPEGTGPCP